MRNVIKHFLLGSFLLSSLSISAKAYDGRYIHKYQPRATSMFLSPRIYVVVWYGKTNFLPHVEKFYHKTPAMTLQEELKSRGYKGSYVVNISQNEYPQLVNKLKWVYVDSCLTNVQNIDFSKYPMFNASLFKQSVQKLLTAHNNKDIASDLCKVNSLDDFLYKISLVRIHDKSLENLTYNIYLYLQEVKKMQQNNHRKDKQNKK